ncbi:preprotein translocase subunit YajC [Polyangium spumosum]|uniref:Sec translocon accessory complex subunit YajC n=1 Tax=Polyangium spumosum TaxID=889282 RepID=A0A6N7PLV3_9BACT|nr:preprotein translocase subunit YajC [Polyangium spumosum]MRG91124.1 preprotein translocase subunit YajC [Polyangium spumosum]
MLFLSQPTTVSPGQGAPPAPAQPSQGAPAAPEGGGGGGQPFGGMTILFFLLPLLFVFLMTRSQSKKQKELEAALKPGDKVVTQAGLIGKLIEVGDRTVKLEIAPGVNVQVLKTAIQGVDGEPKPAAEAKDKAQEKKA